MKLTTYITNNIEIIIFFSLVIIFILCILNRNWKTLFNNQHGINRLDAIIYISLYNPNNTSNILDNTDLFMKELKKLNTNMKKVHKVNTVCNHKNGNNDCIQSHIIALKMIKKNNWNRVLIIEDDIELSMTPETINELLNKSLESLDKQQSNWDVIMVSSSSKVINTKIESIPIDININMNTSDKESMKIQIQKIKSASSSSAYIVKNSYVDNIINLFNSKTNQDLPLDHKWQELQNKDNWFSFDKEIIKQREN